jgi:hypothetical protein
MRIQRYGMITLLVTIVFCLGSQSFSSEENMRTKGDADMNGENLGRLSLIEYYSSHGLREAALKICEDLLLSFPDSKAVRLERIEIYKKMKEPAKAQRDLDYLFKHYPDLEATYLEQAQLFLDVPFPDKGDHPLIEWLRSTDHRKSKAALKAIQEVIRANREKKSAAPQ